jgi:hypothetical protein
MAKPKHTVALFEVLHRNPQALTPKPPPWWSRNRPPVMATAQKSAAAYPVQKAPQPAPPAATAQPALPFPPMADVQPVQPPGELPPAVASAADSLPAATALGDEATGDRPAPSPPGATESRLPQIKDLRRMLTPTSVAMIASFAVVLVIAVFLISRLRNRAYAYGASVSTAVLRQQPPHPDVLNVRGGVSGGAATAGGGSAAKPPVLARGSSAGAINVGGPQPAAPGATPPVQNQRKVGLNYVLVQSYAEKQYADNACQFLANRGVACSVEFGVPGWARSYCVVGTDGYTGPGSPDCQAMLQKIRGLSPGYARAGSYIAFSPMVVKWKLADH